MPSPLPTLAIFPATREPLTRLFYMPGLRRSAKAGDSNGISFPGAATGRRSHRALDEYDAAVAAALSEHCAYPGMGDSDARFVRDKLPCGCGRARGRHPCPEFSRWWNGTGALMTSGPRARPHGSVKTPCGGPPPSASPARGIPEDGLAGKLERALGDRPILPPEFGGEIRPPRRLPCRIR